MPDVSLSGVFNVYVTQDDGDPGASYRLYTYAPGTTTHKDAYTESTGTTVHTYTSDGGGGQYIAVNSRGELPAPLYLTTGSYDLCLKTDAGVTVWTRRATGMGDFGTFGAYNSETAYAVGTIGGHLRGFVSPLDAPYLAPVDGSTDATTAISAAVAHAYSTGKVMLWPDLTFVTTATIPNFHDVPHIGNGIISRSGNLFYVNPTASQTNTLFCSPSGVLGNDGLSSSQPTTIQGAFNKLTNYGPSLNGLWDISLAAGTYTTGEHTIARGLHSLYPILIYGPEVSGGDPTAVIDGNGYSSAFGIQAERGTSLYVKNIEFWRYGINGTSDSGGGILVEADCFLATYNCHFTNCYDGIISFHSRIVIGGPGIHTMYAATAGQPANYSGIKSMYSTHHTIGATYNRTTGAAPYDGVGNGPSFVLDSTKVGRAVYISEGSTGHVEGLSIDEMSNGIQIESRSRAHVADCSFKSCTNAILLGAGSDWFDGGGNTFNAGTLDYNLQAIRFENTGTQSGGPFGSALLSIVTNQVFTADDATIDAGTGGVEQIAHTFQDYFAGYEFQQHGKVTMRVVGSMSGGNGTNRFRMVIGGNYMANVTFNTGVVGDYEVMLEVIMTGNDTQRIFAKGLCSNGTSNGVCEVNTSTTAVNIADGTGQDLVLDITRSSAADTVIVNYIEVSRAGG